jgi:histidinol phosphatase-like PHP family hydrolase
LRESREREITENSHVHTQLSDGKSPILYLAIETAALGMDYLGLSDHWDPLEISEGNYNERCINEPFNRLYQQRRVEIENFIENNQADERGEKHWSLDIADGAELEYYFGSDEDLKEKIEEANFDYINLSVHMDKDGNSYTSIKPENRKEATRLIANYFRDMRSALAFADDIETIKVVSHPDRIELNTYLNDFFEEDEFKDILEEEYRRLIEDASETDVLPELNGRILLRNGPTKWFESLSGSEIDYAVGTDTHRSGTKTKENEQGKQEPVYPWANETQARITALETAAKAIGRDPEPVLEDIETSSVDILRGIGDIDLDENPEEKIQDSLEPLLDISTNKEEAT